MKNKQQYAQITALGGYLPINKRTNADLERLSDTSDEWIMKRTGIKERRILEDNRATSDMAVEAIKEMCASYNRDYRTIDALLVATSSPDMPMPSTANIICGKLNLDQVWAFDVNAACSGFLYALDMGAALIETGRYKNVVVVGADKISSFVDVKDRSTNILFGDGAGAVWLEPAKEEGIIDALLLSEGTGTDYLNIKGGGSLYSYDTPTWDTSYRYLQQDGKVVFKHAVNAMSTACRSILERNQLTTEDVSWLVAHQANKRIIDAVGKELELEADKALNNITYSGNTIAATIPLCLWEFKHQLKKGDLILLTAFGAGFSWGASLLKWNI